MGSKDRQEDLCHDKADDTAAGERKDPRQHHFLYDTEIDRRKALYGTDTHDRGCFGMRCGNRNTKSAGEEKTESACKVCSEALILFKVYHVHTDGFDDLFTANAGTDTHNDTAKEHQPDRDLSRLHIRIAVCKGDAEQKNAKELLTVLCAVHEAHCRCTEDLCALKGFVCLTAIDLTANDRDQLTDDPTACKAEQKA